MDDAATDSAGDGASERHGGPAIGDAFGEMLRDHHAGEDTYEIVERDDGWIGPSAGGEFYVRGFEEWTELEQRAMDHVEGRVLDVGCGAGRHARYLQSEGHDVTGIDLSPGAIAVARDRGVEDVREVDVANVATEFAPDTFDSVIMMGKTSDSSGLPTGRPESCVGSPRLRPTTRRWSHRLATRQSPTTRTISRTTSSTASAVASRVRSGCGSVTAPSRPSGTTTSWPHPKRWPTWQGRRPGI